MQKLMVILISFFTSPILFAGAKDRPFVQDYSIKYQVSPELAGARFSRLLIDRNGVVYVLSDFGVARTYGKTLVLDRSFRPLARKHTLNLGLFQGNLFYLFPERLLSNAEAGRYLFHLPNYRYNDFEINSKGEALLLGDEDFLLLQMNTGEKRSLPRPPGKQRSRPVAAAGAFYVAIDSTIYRIHGQKPLPFYPVRSHKITALAYAHPRLWVGTGEGYFALNAQTGEQVLSLQTRLPWRHITCFVPSKQGLWVGTTRGAFLKKTTGQTNYYASKRWLPDDFVIDMAPDANGNMFILTRTGLAKIAFREMTLAEKARHYQHILRSRHIRMGFCGETRLRIPGEVATGEIVDSDNDGLWSAMYMAAEAFRFAVTGNPEAQKNAWETFAALERLESITPIEGFPARSFERIGFKFADRDRWHPTADREWDWKGTTSSDEFVGHIFGYAVMYETVAKTPQERQRIVAVTERIMDHILRNHLYFIDIDGKPTLWGRWSPEYLNNIPFTVGDRRLNSVEIIGALQFAYAISGKQVYRKKAFELLNRHGYLRNIMNSMKNLRYTDHPLGDEWNHSDDELAFLAYWALYHYAFNDSLRQKFAETIDDHWQIEKIERNPLWNFIYASTGARDYDLEGALWTLREFPLDMVDWRVNNSYRKDLTLLPANFRNQESKELLPPDERRLMRWNGNPFTLDGGASGYSERTGETFLLPYWMGRYLKCIE
ncbi:MAG: hypothetical protein D6814_13835 [Calditrichaeota bacterium]|nr:MAG: hypothetical protein D6814_13835 [Calditrichota bacterium]